MSDDQELIKAFRQGWKEQARFFSNPAKGERERWVVGEFLTQLRISFVADELVSEPTDGPIDVRFGEACFQVKELPDPCVQRGAEIKARLRRAEAATSADQLVYPAKAVDTLFTDAVPRVLEHARHVKYVPTRATLDLLFYLTDPHGFVTDFDRLAGELRLLGWRSVSFLDAKRAQVLVAADSAPSFLRQQ